MGEQAQASRRSGLHEDYMNCFHRDAEVQPCRDACLLRTAARYLRTEPEPRETFTVFPFYQVLSSGLREPGADCRALLTAFIKAAELLEIICVNLFLQPWKKEIKTLKTFTGPFVYCLLPVFSSSTIQSVLASIGYVPHTDTPLSEYRLSEDANLDRAMLVGFELLLARVECYRLLERLDKDQLGPQEWLELLQRRAGSTKMEEPTEMKTTIGKEEEEEVEEKPKEEADRKQLLSCLDPRLAVNPQPKPRRHHLISVDQSLMEMQMTYPDLAIRGRPLLPDKPQRAHSSRSSNKAVHMGSDESRTADVPARDYIRDTKPAAATTIGCRNYGSKGAEVLGENGRGSGCNDNNSGQTTVPGDAASSCAGNTDTSRVDDELSHPQAMSLHITLRTGSTLGQRLKPGEPQPTAEPPAWNQQQTAADLQNKTLASPELSSVSSTEDEQELRELAERMGQLYVHDGKELKRKGENMRGDENTNKGRRKKERKTSSEREAEEQILRRPVLETGTGLSQAATRSTRSSQSDAATMKEHELSPQSASRTQYQRCKGGSTGHQEGADAETDQGEEEQLAQSYVIVEHHKK